MFEILYTLEKEASKMTEQPKIGVEPCIKLYYGFVVVCGCCIYIGGCKAPEL